MFLEALARRNPGLVRTAVELHQAGELPPNCFVLDLDAIRRNARLIRRSAEESGLQVYPMAKQVGHNPLFVRALARAGMPKFVCVDWTGVRLLAEQRAHIGHVGHLVQIPRHAVDLVCGLGPEVWTVFNLKKALEVSAAAQRAERVQDLLLRVVAPGDTFYPTHDGGFQLAEIVDAAKQIGRIPNVRVVGVTSFPTLLFDPDRRTVLLTQNMETIVLTAERLRDEAGLEVAQINAPGTTSAKTMRLLAEAGATHVEPGHGFTGTTPWHAYADLPEKPAMCYLTEVTDIRADVAYILGGGFFIDPVIPRYQVQAFVGKAGQEALHRRADADLGPSGGIDYYVLLDTRSAKIEIGDSVVFGFRAQVFATRAYVGVVRGVSRQAPRVAGIYDACGRKLRHL